MPGSDRRDLGGSFGGRLANLCPIAIPASRSAVSRPFPGPSRRRGRHRDHAVFAGWAHVTHLTSDLVYGIGTLITGPGVLVATDRSPAFHRHGVGCRQRVSPPTPFLRSELWLDGQDGESRHLADHGRSCARIVSGLLGPLGIEHTLQYRRGVPPVVNEERSTQILHPRD